MIPFTSDSKPIGNWVKAAVCCNFALNKKKNLSWFIYSSLVFSWYTHLPLFSLVTCSTKCSVQSYLRTLAWWCTRWFYRVSLYVKIKCVSFDMQVKFNLKSWAVFLCGTVVIHQAELAKCSNILRWTTHVHIQLFTHVHVHESCSV